MSDNTRTGHDAPSAVPSLPEFQSKRLEFRRTFPSDAARITELVADPRIYRMLSRVGPTQIEPATLAWLSTHESGQRSDRNHVFAIVADGELVGVTGAERVTIGQPFEIGYWLAPHMWGKGLMTEAAGALKHWLVARGERAITSGYFADNPASGRVLQKLGFMKAGRCPKYCLGRDEMVDHFEMAWIADKA